MHPLRAIVIAFLALGWLGVALRFYVRQYIVKRLRVDDWLMLTSAVSLLHYILVTGWTHVVLNIV